MGRDVGVCPAGVTAVTAGVAAVTAGVAAVVGAEPVATGGVDLAHPPANINPVTSTALQ